MLEVVGEDARLLLLAQNDRHLLAQGKDARHGNVGVLAHNVGLAVVQRVAVVPPLGRRALDERNDKQVQPVRPPRVARHGKVAHVVLQPARLSLIKVTRK